MTDSPDSMPARSRNGRIQRFWVFTLLVIACAAGWRLWGVHPWLAIAVALVVAANHVLVLGLEFMLLPTLATQDPAPKPNLVALVSAWLTESWQCWRVFAWRQPFRWRAIPDRLQGDGVQGRRGVVLLHGFFCNRGFWAPWLKRLIAGRRAFIAVNLEPPFSSIDRYGPLIDEAVAKVRTATGLPPLVVCHSMGGLAARAWLAQAAAQGGSMADRVHAVVTIGSPHAGTWMARFSQARNGQQMRLGSEWLQHLGQAWLEGRAGLPAEKFLCWYSNADNIVLPPSTATLAGADNRLVWGVGHVGLAFQREVMTETLARLD